MASSWTNYSDNNGCTYGADFLKLARELEVPETLLGSALEEAAYLMREWSPSIRPVDKKALRGVARSLARAIEQLSETGVRERLTAAVSEEPEEPDADDGADYCAWLAAQHRVDQAMEGARDLLEIVKSGEAINFPPGRPQQYDRWQIGVRSLLRVWIEDLRRKVTISRHPDDGPGVKPSPALRFVYQSMWLIGEDIDVHKCRSILLNLKEEGYNFGMDLNEF